MNNIPLPVLIFFGLIYVVGLVCILKPDNLVNLTTKYFKWSMKLWGFEGDIKPTPRARLIVRWWNAFVLLCITFFLFLNLMEKCK